MRQLYIFIFFFTFFSTVILCQQKITVRDVESKFQALEFASVIQLVDSLFSLNEEMDSETKINLLIWKGVSYYSLGDNKQTRKCFIEILKLDRDFTPDPVIISPKIIDYFNNIREEFHNIVPLQQKITNPDSVATTYSAPLQINSALYKNAVARSLIFPGWGHLYSNQTTKGWILTTASVAAAASIVYLIFDTDSKERSYLNEANTLLIQQKYDKYNTSYKFRNAAIISYAVIWLYSQL
ncbi:MAG: hypothetical protein V1720_05550, partial [bacterium]